MLPLAEAVEVVGPSCWSPPVEVVVVAGPTPLALVVEEVVAAKQVLRCPMSIQEALLVWLA